MKTKVIKLMAVFFLAVGTAVAQDIPESQVPSLIVNNFKKEFPKATDVEWEREGDIYNVDFEIGLFTDYEAWFTASGTLIKCSMEIPAGDLPKAVTNSIKKEYKGYRIDEAKKIIKNGVETYEVEIEKGNDERELVYSKNGKLI
ncbi:MAG: PepSY-like domain-containing protein [Bacteroidales bacterium]|nr:PepSY-like domain-containing protein [Bacteroidales bacterium]